MKTILIGYGEVGQSIYKVFSQFHDISIIDINIGQEIKGSFEVMLVAIPYTKNFIEIVKEYQKKFNPQTTIVFSTVSIGTCSQLNAIHSPIEGKHPYLTESIKKHKRWLGGKNLKALEFFVKAGFMPKVLDKSEYTEFLKLRSTTLYGLNIEFARYSKKIADDIGLKFDFIKDFDNDYNKLYEDTGFKRYILDAPQGKIGGHCVLPNAKILQNQYPNELVNQILINNK